jgi:hypothetical protein
MAKKPRGGGGGRHTPPAGQKPTLPDVPGVPLRPTLVPRQLSRQAREAAMKAAADKEAAALEARRRRDLAKATLDLDPMDLAILEHVLRFAGITQEQIGDLVGLSRQTVNERVNSDKFQKALAHASRSSLEIFESNKAKAARKLGALIDNPDVHVALRASIAHLWPTIHAPGGTGTKDEDFVAFVQEAFERANGAREDEAAAAGGKPAPS